MTAVATRTVEVMHVAPESTRATLWLNTLSRSQAVESRTTTTYRGGSDFLLLWGPGALSRFDPMRKQLAAGGHVLALDLAYWDRNRKARISIDSAHPQAWVMRKLWPSTRLYADGISVSNQWNQNGPIVIAGIGAKAKTQYGPDVVDRWEASMARQCAERYGRPVLYRRKKFSEIVPGWAKGETPNGPIENVLNGASLLVTWHSNVAVDAIRMGIPVVCHDGAAAAVCPSALPEEVKPLSDELRHRFLSNLAHFQWAIDETDELWAFVERLLS